jgi:hypothetical protein
MREATFAVTCFYQSIFLSRFVDYSIFLTINFLLIYSILLRLGDRKCQKSPNSGTFLIVSGVLLGSRVNFSGIKRMETKNSPDWHLFLVFPMQYAFPWRNSRFFHCTFTELRLKVLLSRLWSVFRSFFDSFSLWRIKSTQKFECRIWLRGSWLGWNLKLSNRIIMTRMIS